jgi:hypothetical protein
VKGRAIVAAILAVGVTTVLVLVAITIVSASLDGKSLSTEGGSLVAGVIGTVVGALAVYLGESSSETPPRPVEQASPWLPGGALPGDPDPDAVVDV